MTPLFRKTSVLDKRLKEIQKELSMVEGDIRSLSKAAKNPESAVELSRLFPEGGQAQRRVVKKKEEATQQNNMENAEKKSVGKDGMRKEKNMMRDKRFLSYLMSSGFQPTVRPLRHERRLQRNKAIVMVVFALLVLLWVLFRFFL